MKVSDAMTQRPVSIEFDATLEEAARRMVHEGVSGLPVVDPDGQVVGVVTDGDLLRRAEIGTEKPRAGWFVALFEPGRMARDYVVSHARKVDEVMSRDVIAISPDAPLSEAVTLMEARQIKRLPVLDQGKLVGVIGRSDLLRAFLQAVRPVASYGASDAEVLRAVLARIAAQSWAPGANIETQVNGGVVRFRGTITDERHRLGLRVIAENCPGVKAVDDQLVWIEPLSGIVLDAQAIRP